MFYFRPSAAHARGMQGIGPFTHPCCHQLDASEAFSRSRFEATTISTTVTPINRLRARMTYQAFGECSAPRLKSTTMVDIFNLAKNVEQPKNHLPASGRFSCPSKKGSSKASTAAKSPWQRRNVRWNRSIQVHRISRNPVNRFQVMDGGNHQEEHGQIT